MNLWTPRHTTRHPQDHWKVISATRADHCLAFSLPRKAVGNDQRDTSIRFAYLLIPLAPAWCLRTGSLASYVAHRNGIMADLVGQPGHTLTSSPEISNIITVTCARHSVPVTWPIHVFQTFVSPVIISDTCNITLRSVLSYWSSWSALAMDFPIGWLFKAFLALI